MNIYKRMLVQSALLIKAVNENKTIEEYCHPNTDYIIVNKNDEISVYWDAILEDFVVWGDYHEAKEIAEADNEKVVRLVPWLKRHKIITSTYQLVKIAREK